MVIGFGLVVKIVICIFCKGFYSFKDCFISMIVEVRFEKVREVKVYFRCGRMGYYMVKCRYRK